MDEEVVRALQEEFARVREYAERLYETRVNMDHANQAAIDVLISHLLAKLPSEEVDSWFDSDSDSDFISAKLIPEEERGADTQTYIATFERIRERVRRHRSRAGGTS